MAERSVSFRIDTLRAAVREPLSTLRQYTAYAGCALTGVAPDAASLCEYDLQILAEFLQRTSIRDCGLNLYRPAEHTHPDRHDDRLPYEVLRENLLHVARSAVMFCLVNPPSTGMGMEMAFALNARMPIVLLQRVSTSNLRDHPKPILKVNPNETGCDLAKVISSMIRGIPLVSPNVSLVRYSGPQDFQAQLSAYLGQGGDELLEAGCRRFEHRLQYWAPSGSKLLQRRRVLGVSRATLAEHADCHTDLIVLMEKAPEVFSCIGPDVARGTLELLGYGFDPRIEEDGRPRMYVSRPSPNWPSDSPLPVPEYKRLKQSHQALEDYRDSLTKHQAGDGLWDDYWESLWMDARTAAGCSSAVFRGGRWVEVETDRDSEAMARRISSKAGKSLFEEGVTTPERFRLKMPETVADWKMVASLMR